MSAAKFRVNTLVKHWTKKRDLILCSSFVDAIENFDYMNGVNKTNYKYFISSSSILNETLAITYNGVMFRTP